MNLWPPRSMRNCLLPWYRVIWGETSVWLGRRYMNAGYIIEWLCGRMYAHDIPVVYVVPLGTAVALFAKVHFSYHYFLNKQ